VVAALRKRRGGGCSFAMATHQASRENTEPDLVEYGDATGCFEKDVRFVERLVDGGFERSPEAGRRNDSAGLAYRHRGTAKLHAGERASRRVLCMRGGG